MFETALREELFLKTMTRMDMVASSLGSTQIGVSKTPTRDLMFFLKCMFLSKQSENIYAQSQGYQHGGQEWQLKCKLTIPQN